MTASVVIDAGNSRIKSGWWDGEQITPAEAIPTLQTEPPADWRRYEPSAVALSNVAGSDVAARIQSWCDDLWSLKANDIKVQPSAAGVRTLYDNPGQLGVDRWLAAIAGYRLVEGAVAVVDAGTAITIDIVNHDGEHLGGSIAPGLNLMTGGLTRNTAQLSLNELTPPHGIATNTQAAISAGCSDALVGGIREMKARLENSLGLKAMWIITGGEAEIINELMPNFFQLEPHLVMYGVAAVMGEST